MDNKHKTIMLHGRIDSDNAAVTEQELFSKLDAEDTQAVILDAGDLEYISSAGLRVLLHLRKSFPDVRVINANSQVYEIFDITGFTEMLHVERAYRSVSIDNCEEIGSGANGKIYRIDKDNVVKVFGEYTDPADIRYEREVAKLALILGIPTAISYEVVKVGDRYGSVYELLDAVTFSHLLATDPDKVDWCAEESVRILKKIHETAVPAGKLPDVRQKALSKIDSLEDFLGKDVCLKLRTLIEEVPYSDRMIHGDYHTKNLMLMNDEVLLIDMETLAVGHPVFEFGPMFNAYSGFSELDRGQFNRFQGYDYSLAERLWRRSLEIYFNTDDDAFLKDVVDKARIPGYIRMMNFMIVHDGMNNANDRKLLEHWRTELIDLVGHTDTIVFDQDYGK